MLLFFLLCNILFIPLICGTNMTLEVDHNSTKSLASNESHTLDLGTNKTIIPSEGGLIQDKHPVTLSINHTLLSLDNELSKDKVNATDSKVVPRKGVVYPGDNITDASRVTKTSQESPIETEKTSKHVSSERKDSTVSHIIPRKGISNKTLLEETSNHTEVVNTTEMPKPKKPLILSDEALLNAAKYVKHDELNIPIIKSSSKPGIDQLTTPSKDSGPTMKVMAMNPGRHPGMIMPIVIAILVVPMFAVLGYMALRRGQEAWKNRHYKRMDFLLDGMYND